MTRVPYPWHSVEANQRESEVTVRIWGREMRQAASLFPVSLKTQGQELLHAPIRLCGVTNGEAICWEDQGCYLLEPEAGHAIVNGFAQSQCLIANSTLRWEYDGGAVWDVKVMPRGLTVPQVFGLEECPVKAWKLEKLSLEIPLKKGPVSLYVSWPAGGVRARQDGRELAANGAIPPGGLSMPFKPGIFLGNEDVGLQLTCDSDEKWQPERPESAVEILDKEDHWVLRFRLLDTLPRTWTHSDQDSPHVNFTFGLMMTPVKPMDPAFQKLHAVHIDCFDKIEGDYWPFLNGAVSRDNPEKVIDRLQRAGVNLLILHEKWNKIQNYWEYAVTTKDEIIKLVRLCHERGIRVIPYFGYEITSPMPEFARVQQRVTWMGTDREGCRSSWYRVPYQRAHRVCYQSEWSDRLAEGILKCIDDFEFDGVYLDSMTAPEGCVNAAHGCGYTDAEGKRHPTYPVFATRESMKKICEGVHQRHGIVNPHPSGATFPFITAGSDFLWDGEHIQTAIWKNGPENFSLDYFRTEYIGKNLGIPVQFIVYETKGAWSFDMALSLCLIHGIYPRPNSVHHPLDVMERIWRITDRYGIADAAFRGYWENSAEIAANNEVVKVSYYIREQMDRTLRLLIYAANPGPKPSGSTAIVLNPQAFGGRKAARLYNVLADEPADGITVNLPAYGTAIYEAILK